MTRCDGYGTFVREMQLHAGDPTEVAVGNCDGCAACMKMLTLRQPWPMLIALGVKTIETRTFATEFRGPIAIHAAKKWDSCEVGGWLLRKSNLDGSPELWPPETHNGLEGYQDQCHRMVRCSLGAVVCVADLDDTCPTWNLHFSEEPGWRVIVERSGVDHVEHVFVGRDQEWFGDFYGFRYAWNLTNVRPLKTPVPAKGFQGLRACPSEVADAIQAQLVAV